MQTSSTEISILEESTWGVLPSPASFVATRVTGESLKVERENVVSEEIRPDRNIADLIQVGGQASGGIECELSYGTYDKLLESAMNSAFVADSMVNGTTEKSFQIQKKQQGNNDTTTYEVYAGMVVDTFALNINTKQKTTCSFTFIGKNGTISESVTGTVSAATSTGILDGSNGFVLDSAFGVSPAPSLMSLTLNINNNLAAKGEAGKVDLLRVSAGRCNVSGSASFYFQSKALMDLFLAGTGGELSFTIGNTTSQKYTFTMPNVKIQDADHFSPGNDEDVMLNITFQALYNAGISGTLQIDRAVA